MRCRNCEFYWKIDLKHGDCSCEKFKKGYNYSFYTECSDEEILSDSVIVENDEGWGFRVGGDFGCIHFKDGRNEK